MLNPQQLCPIPWDSSGHHWGLPELLAALDFQYFVQYDLVAH